MTPEEVKTLTQRLMNSLGHGDARSSRRCYHHEMLGRLLLLGVVGLAFYVSWSWWLPLLVAPLFWQIWDAALGQRSRIFSPLQKIVADWTTFAFCLAYLIMAVLLVGQDIGHWYGWLSGVVVGFSVSITPLCWLYPHRWHLEAVQRRL